MIETEHWRIDVVVWSLW